MKKIKIYTIPMCPHCITLKKYLKENKIEFENIDIEANEDAAEEIIKKTGQSGFPIIDIGGKIVIGFSKEELKSLLK